MIFSAPGNNKDVELTMAQCSGRVKKATLGSDRKGQYGSGKKGQSEEKATTMVHTPYIMMSANASTI
jgi:hypothetical protein